MKELSIKEKAKLYDEAKRRGLDYIRLTPATELVTRQSILEYIFPELKESEDERMIQYFKDLAPFDKADELYEKYGFSHKDAISWLEKQGGHAKFINGIQVGDKVTRNEDGVLVNLSQLKRVAKPVEPMIVGQEPLYDYTNANICQKDFAEQKPAWSEEDEKMFGYLEDIVNFCYCNQYVVNVQTCNKVRQLVFRLKSLCFQSGWGKDDITRINEIIETLNIVQANRVHTQRMHYNKATIDKNIDWLKSLKDRVRPQSTWKPSDEQMNNK